MKTGVDGWFAPHPHAEAWLQGAGAGGGASGEIWREGAAPVTGTRALTKRPQPAHAFRREDVSVCSPEAGHWL